MITPLDLVLGPLVGTLVAIGVVNTKSLVDINGTFYGTDTLGAGALSFVATGLAAIGLPRAGYFAGWMSLALSGYVASESRGSVDDILKLYKKTDQMPDSPPPTTLLAAAYLALPVFMVAYGILALFGYEIFALVLPAVAFALVLWADRSGVAWLRQTLAGDKVLAELLSSAT